MDQQKITCPLCGMEFKTKEEHEAHHTQMHAGAPAGEELSFTVCGFKTRDKNEMDRHEKTHTAAKM